MKTKFYSAILVVFIISSCTEKIAEGNGRPLNSDIIKKMLPEELFITNSKVIYKDAADNYKEFNIDFFERSQAGSDMPELKLASVMQNEDYYFNLIIDVSRNNVGEERYALIYDFIDHKGKRLVNQVLTQTSARKISGTNLNGKKLNYQGEMIEVFEGTPVDGDFGCKEMYFSLRHGIVQFTDRENTRWVLEKYEL